MSQSQLLTNALKAAELVLSAETADTAELAKMAADASGIPANRILLGIDLTGIDLKDKEITHLLDKQAKYHSALISEKQRKEFENFERKGSTRRVRTKIRSLQVEAVIEFIEHYEIAIQDLDVDASDLLPDVNSLRKILLSPIQDNASKDIIFGINYAVNVVGMFVTWARRRNIEFYVALFDLLSRMQVPMGKDVVAILNSQYFPAFGLLLGDIIAAMSPTSELDSYWVVNIAKYNSMPNNKSLQQVLRRTSLARAQQISMVRPVHFGAVEEALDNSKTYLDSLEFLESVDFDCNNDQAERIAVRLTLGDWPDSETSTILNTNTNSRVRGALFRQLLLQGKETRVIEILRWLNGGRGRGAVGALSLDDALQHIRSFALVLRFAQEAAPSFADHQLSVIYFKLIDLAHSEYEKNMVNDFLKRVKYTPPKEYPKRPIRFIGDEIEKDRLARIIKQYPIDK